MEDIFQNLDALRIDPMDTSMGSVEQMVNVPVRKPGKSEWFRVSPDAAYTIDTTFYETDQDRKELFFVKPEIRALLGNTVKRKRLFTCVNLEMNPFLWAVTLPDNNGRDNSWISVAHEAAQMARVEWTRIEADQSIGTYRVFKPEGQLRDPVWPKMPLGKLLETAFAGRVIDTADHTIIRRLRGIQ